MSVPSGDCDHRHGLSVSMGAALPATDRGLKGVVGTGATCAELSCSGLFAVSGRSNTGEARFSTEACVGCLTLPCSSMLTVRGCSDTSDRIGNTRPMAAPRAAHNATTETVVSVGMCQLPIVAE